jgi:AmmeMemoRadiSam system protein B/AmmeMemoRadiSam system protein A
VLLPFISAAAMALHPAADIKYPAVAGQYYPAGTAELNNAVKSAFASVIRLPKPVGEVKGILVPHANYQYSAGTAAYGFSTIDNDYDYIIVIGTSHTSPKYGLQTCLYNTFRMPTGDVKSDVDLIGRLMKKCKFIKEEETAFYTEHSVEVELPFLLEKVKSFKLIPFVVADISLDDARAAADVIYSELKDKKVLVVISTDLSHYPDFETAKKSDKKITDCFISMDTAVIHPEAVALVVKYFRRGLETAVCGEQAAMVGIEIMKRFGADSAKLLKASNSSISPALGHKSRVVGYAAVAFYRKDRAAEIENGLDISIDDRTKIKMLKYARQAIENYIKTKQIPIIDDRDKIFGDYYGIFVTLNKNNELRGCMGTTDAVMPLRRGIPQIACSAAFGDYGFKAVGENELRKIDIEISILSPYKKIKNTDEIIMGKHGVMVTKDQKTGLLLPQVTQENGWSKEKFLNEICTEKAGLPYGAWKQKGTELYVFTVCNFSEKEMGVKY